MTERVTSAPAFDDVVYNPDRRFPSWHYRMLNDAARNRAIEAAIAALPVAGKTVFEIGAGAGLIALLFAKHGAARVYTCEINRHLCDIARRIADHSEYRDRIEIFDVSSGEVVRRGLLPEAPDIIFTETVDSGVIGEGFFGIAADIKALMGPDTVVLPQRIDQFGMLVDSQAFYDLNFVHDVCGFDLSFLNTYSTPGYLPVWAALHDYAPLSESVLLRSYDYTVANPAEARPLPVTRSGRAHGLLTWFALRFGAETATSAVDAKSHWHQAFHPFKAPVAVSQDRTIVVTLENDGTASISNETAGGASGG